MTEAELARIEAAIADDAMIPSVFAHRLIAALRAAWAERDAALERLRDWRASEPPLRPL